MKAVWSNRNGNLALPALDPNQLLDLQNFKRLMWFPIIEIYLQAIFLSTRLLEYIKIGFTQHAKP